MQTTTRGRAWERYPGNPAEVYDAHFLPAIGGPIAAELIEAVRPGIGERVLDVACGTGVVARLALEQVGPAGRVVGVDGHPGMLQVGAAADPDARIKWLQGPAEDLPVQDASFDVVSCSLGLQFFADPARAVAQMRRVAAPGGRVAVALPGPTPALFAALHDALLPHLGPEAAGFVRVVFGMHDPDVLIELLSSAGLEPVQVVVKPLHLRLPAPADFLWQYLLGTPLADAVAELSDTARLALEDDVLKAWESFADDDGTGIEIPIMLRIGTGRVGA